MRHFLFLVGLFALFVGFQLWTHPAAPLFAVHALLAFLIGIVAIGSGAIIDAIERAAPPRAK